MIKESTCGNCKHVKFGNMGGLATAYCDALRQQFIVPHQASLEHGRGSDSLVTFWRVPNFCPRPDDEVLKSEEQVPATQWVHSKIMVEELIPKVPSVKMKVALEEARVIEGNRS